MGVVVQRYIDILIIIITFPYFRLVLHVTFGLVVIHMMVQVFFLQLLHLLQPSSFPLPSTSMGHVRQHNKEATSTPHDSLHSWM